LKSEETETARGQPSRESKRTSQTHRQIAGAAKRIPGRSLERHRWRDLRRALCLQVCTAYRPASSRLPGSSWGYLRLLFAPLARDYSSSRSPPGCIWFELTDPRPFITPAQAPLSSRLRLLKGGDPAAPSGTATLLRLHPPYRPHLRHLRPKMGSASDFGCNRLGWCDGRCVQGPGTYSTQYADLRLLATPTSCRRVAACNPN
jgi:hypothetical protein